MTFLAANPSSVAISPKVTDDPAYTNGNGAFHYLRVGNAGLRVLVR